jgi:outer membrane protein OmpA-like peptidoglycan-associated protein/tetratricopeptide (TPR) repeat protein
LNKNKYNLTMKLKSLLYITLFGASVSAVQAQKSQLKEADKQYNSYAYVDAIKTYERIAEKGYRSVDMFQKLGNSYYYNADLANANKWYEQLFAMNETIEPEYYYKYSQTLKSIGDYKKADEMLAQFNNLSGNDERAKLFASNKNYLQTIKANSNRFSVTDAGINSAFYDYGTSFFGDKLVFTSTREDLNTTKKSQWNTQNYATMYAVDVMADGQLGSPVKFSNNLTTKLNEDTPVFTKDGKTIYFTRNNLNDGKQRKDINKTTLLKIYSAKFDGKDWTAVTELPFNSDQYSVAHPALSPDDKTLYFVSDMPGTLGGADIFKVAVNADGTFGTPMNLGNTINTPGRESFPFVSDNNELYFATDGHQGLGGLDIFVSKINKDGSFVKPQNIGEPVNSKTDDFGFIIDAKTRNGFFTSNRAGGKGFDDIYKFTETKSLDCKQELSGIVTDEASGMILPGAALVLLNSKFEEISKTVSDGNASYKFDVACGEMYYVRGQKQNYETSEQKIKIENVTGKSKLPVTLNKKQKEIAVGDDLAKTLNIPIIFFDLNKSLIRPDAALELEKVLDVMKEYPKMVVDIRSHTDCRATAKYNESLSDRRAKSTMAWLVKNGIQQNRLTAKGYGESKLLNKCADGVQCTEEEHQANRRSEFIVVSMGK